MISRDFSFPDLCTAHGRLGQLGTNTFSKRGDMFHRNVLLRTGSIYLSVVVLQGRRRVLARQLQGTRRLSTVCTGHLRAKSTGMVRAGGVGLRLLGIGARTSLGRATLHGGVRRLATLGKGVPIIFRSTSCPTIVFPSGCRRLGARILTSSCALRTLGDRDTTTHGRVTVGGSR